MKLEVEPNEGEGFVFDSRIVGGSIPREFIGPVETGVREAMESGALAGYELQNITVTLAGRFVSRRGLLRTGLQDRWVDGVQGRG